MPMTSHPCCTPFYKTVDCIVLTKIELQVGAESFHVIRPNLLEIRARTDPDLVIFHAFQ